MIKEYAVEARMVVRETFMYVMEASKKFIAEEYELSSIRTRSRRTFRRAMYGL